MATGCLSTPQEAHFDGIESFQGRVVSTNNWPQDLDLANQRVAIIGTGSTGIQTAPILAKQASEFYVLQRTPNFATPAHHSSIDPKLQKIVTERWEEYRALLREHPAGGSVFRHGPWGLQAAASQKPADLKQKYEKAWGEGGLIFAFTFRDIAYYPEGNKTAADFINSKIKETVKDPATASLLQPDYPFCGKRPCVESGYFEMFNRDNVQLVDIKNKSLKFVAEGVQVNERKIEVDTVVLAIGFDAMTGSLLKPTIRGRGGQTLKEHWQYGPTTYLGLQVAGFPNFFMCTGPGSPSVLSNVVSSIEQHVDWIAGCLDTMLAKDISVIEARPESENAWTIELEETAKPTVYHWASADSWYKGANIPGKPRMFMPYAGGVGAYRAICDAEVDSGYPGFVMRKADGTAVGPTMLQSLTAVPRKYAYKGKNLITVGRMLFERGGKDSIVGAAWDDAQIRARL